MNWRTKRQSIGIGIVVIIILAIGIRILVGVLKVEPTCFDNKLNGDETGIDCGGSCALVCPFESRDLSISWQRVFRVVPGVYNAVAYVENQNTSSGVFEIPYRFRLYDDKNLIVAERIGKTFIGPNDRLAIVESGFETGNRIPTQAFFEFLAPPVWQQVDEIFNKRLVTVRDQKLENETTRPRITAVLENMTLDPIYNIEATVIVYNKDGNSIQTGITVVPELLALSRQEIFFTWPEPFGEPVSRIEVISRINVFNQ